MPQAPLIGKVATPDFNILGALIGGPRYMSQYLAARDQATQAQNQMSLNADWARGLEKTPEFLAGTQARDRPQWDLWATMQGGNAQQSALGTSLLESGIAQGYGRDMATFQQKLQQQNTTFTADTQLGLYKKEQDYAQAQGQQLMQSRLNMLTDPQYANNEVLKSSILNSLGVPNPEPGFHYVVGPQGQLGQTPIPGTPAEQKMFEEIQPIQAIQKNNDDLLTMFNSGIPPSTSAWRDTKAWMVLQMKDLVKSGALDADSVAHFDQMIPNRWDDVNPANRNDIAEMLRVNNIQLQSKLNQARQKWYITTDRVPNVALGPGSLPPGAAPVPEGPPIPPKRPVATTPKLGPDQSITAGEVVKGAASSIWDQVKKPAVPLRRGK